MRFRIVGEPLARLEELADIPMAFDVERVLAVSVRAGGLGGLLLSEQTLERPYRKDYDALEGEGPQSWGRRFDLSSWGFVGAHDESGRIGGAVVACRTGPLNMLEGRSDLAVLWDLRVAPNRGVWASARRSSGQPSCGPPRGVACSSR